MSRHINKLASLISESVSQSPQRLFYEYLESSPRVRINQFCAFCANHGVQVVAEEVIDILASDPNYMFHEGQDKYGRYWTPKINEGYIEHSTQAGPSGPSSIPRPHDNDQGDLDGFDDFSDQQVRECSAMMPECGCGPDCGCDGCQEQYGDYYDNPADEMVVMGYVDPEEDLMGES